MTQKTIEKNPKTGYNYKMATISMF